VPIREKDIPFLLVKFLDKCAEKWKDIGRTLGFTDSDLNSISQSKSEMSDAQCLEQLLNKWCHRQPTIEKLCVALCSEEVGFCHIAEELYGKRMVLESVSMQ